MEDLARHQLEKGLNVKAFKLQKRIFRASSCGDVKEGSQTPKIIVKVLQC
jgi:hypothetical protein